TELALTKIWQEVLGLERVGVTDNFFRIGGDSILSIQVSSRIRQKGYRCQGKDIFTHKSIEKLSGCLESNAQESGVKTEQGLLTGDLGLLPIQQWFIDRVDGGALSRPSHWNQSFLIQVPAL